MTGQKITEAIAVEMARAHADGVPVDAGFPRDHPELEFPDGIGDFALGELADDIDPAAQCAAKRKAEREAASYAREQEDYNRALARWQKWQADMAALRIEEKAARGKAERWKAVRREMKRLGPEPRHPDALGVPLPSQTGVRVQSQELRDGPPPALWSSPYDRGPRGFEVVGS